MKIIEIENNENKDVCKKCGGKCCKNSPCEFAPFQILDDKSDIPLIDQLIKFLECGKYAIDCWDGDVYGKDRYCCYYVRVAAESEETYGLLRLFDTDFWFGRCKLLTDNGCSLSWEERPVCGKSLIPNANGRCTSIYENGKEEMAKLWYEYNYLFENLICDYNIKYNKDSDSYTFTKK